MLFSSTQSENAKLEENVEVLKKELSTEKEKLHTLEQAMQEFGNIEGKRQRNL